MKNAKRTVRITHGSFYLFNAGFFALFTLPINDRINEITIELNITMLLTAPEIECAMRLYASITPVAGICKIFVRLGDGAQKATVLMMEQNGGKRE